MAMPGYTSVDEYIAAQPKAARALLTRVRNVIRKAVPGAEESISYKIPAYKLDGRVLIYFAAWKEHWSLYPSTKRVVAAFKDELTPYELSKGTIRFPLSEPVPAKLIAAIAKLRATEVMELAAQRRTRSTKSRSARGRKGGSGK
jgi:uncharacterized protein YdhG (YjbR/CyaY superfamily)